MIKTWMRHGIEYRYILTPTDLVGHGRTLKEYRAASTMTTRSVGVNAFNAGGRMSVKIMGVVWDANLRSTEKLVLLAYADHAQHDGTRVYPSIESIAQKTGFSERTVQNATRSLEESGWLIPDGAGKNGTNKWRIPVEGVNLLHPESPAGGESPAPPGVNLTTQGGESPAPEPLINRQIKPSVKDSTKKRKPDPFFDAICEVCKIDPKIKGNGARVGKMKRTLSDAGYTAKDVLNFGKWWSGDEWRRKKGPPSIWTLPEKIAIIKSKTIDPYSEEHFAKMRSEQKIPKGDSLS